MKGADAYSENQADEQAGEAVSKHGTANTHNPDGQKRATYFCKSKMIEMLRGTAKAPPGSGKVWR